MPPVSAVDQFGATYSMRGVTAAQPCDLVESPGSLWSGLIVNALGEWLTENAAIQGDGCVVSLKVPPHLNWDFESLLCYLRSNLPSLFLPLEISKQYSLILNAA